MKLVFDIDKGWAVVMRRRRRHPHQAMDAAGLAPGARYMFVTDHAASARCRAYTEAGLKTMAGVVPNAGANLLWNAGAKGEKALARMLNVSCLADGEEAVTVHPDGWNGGRLPAAASLAYWTRDGFRSWDFLHTFLYSAGGEEPLGDCHCIVVPERRWLADPRLHVTDWGAEGGGAPTSPAESAAGFEQRMRAKRDEAMRRFFRS